jgi:mono/diheme cytochrome c family protein
LAGLAGQTAIGMWRKTMRLIHTAFIALGGAFLLMAFVSLWPDDSASRDVAAGKLLHEQTAGGVGCASCHGMNAKGEGLAPDIRDADAERIRSGLMNTGDMADIALSPAQIEQLAAYYHSLKPPVRR